MLNGMKKITTFAAVGLLFVIGCDDKPTGPEDEIPIRIVAPADNSVLLNPVTIIARTGSGFDIDAVDFYIDETLAWTDNSAPYEYYWNIFGYENNSEHVVEVVGNAADTSYTSTPVTVTVSLEEGLLFLSTYRPNSGQAFGVVNFNNAMFVATGEGGVEILSVVDKTVPEYLSRFESAGQAMKVDVQYPDLFIADLSGGVIRADFSDPDSLMENGLYNIQVQANDVAVSENLVFVADQNGFIILDNSLPDSLVSLYRSSVFNQSNYVVARNDTAFLTNIEHMHIINASDPSSPEVIFSYSTPGGALGVAVIDTFAFIADGTEGVIALSISDPQNPEYLAGYVTQGAVSTVEATDSTLFIGTYSGEVIALDYTQADTLRALDNLVIQDVNINQLHFDFPYLFAATSESVTILRFIR
jgi:hypothetical protein